MHTFGTGSAEPLETPSESEVHMEGFKAFQGGMRTRARRALALAGATSILLLGVAQVPTLAASMPGRLLLRRVARSRFLRCTWVRWIMATG